MLGEIALLKNEKIELNNSNLALQKEIAIYQSQIKELNEKIQLLKLANSMGGLEQINDKTELKRKINEYIKEIDRCIALVNE